MSGGSRSLPSHPSLRFLRLGAKRRLAAGEFPTLHEAQGAIAREHGRSSWAKLKQDCTQESHALDQVRWLVSRFSAADRPVQAGPGPTGYRVGLGWFLSPGGDTAVHSGGGLEATAYLRVRVLRTYVALTNRQIPLDSIDLGEADV